MSARFAKKQNANVWKRKKFFCYNHGLENFLDMKDAEKIEIVRAKKSDIDAIMEIENNSFESAIRESKEVFLSRIEVFQKGFLLLKVNGVTAGYFSSELWAKAPESESDFASLFVGHSIKKTHRDDGKSLYVSSFAILPSFRGKGLAHSFFCESLSLIKSDVGFLSAFLVVNPKWQSAQKIYQKEGFSKKRILKRFFENGDDAIFMEKDI